MTRGFTLLELLITISVMMILLASAAPSFSSVIKTVKVQRLASELNGFLMQAKAEAVNRNEDLWVRFSFSKDDPQATGAWYLDMMNSADEVLFQLDGTPFSDINVSHNYSSQKIKFEGVRGRPSAGNITLNSGSISNNVLKLVLSNPPGRIKVCGSNSELYDYPKC